MNHTIEIPDSVFSRLQSIATPLIDEPASVIERSLLLRNSCRQGHLAIARAVDIADQP